MVNRRYSIGFTLLGEELDETASEYLSHILQHKRDITEIHPPQGKKGNQVSLYEENQTKIKLFLSNQVLEISGKAKSIENEVKGIRKLTGSFIKLDRIPPKSI